MTEQEYMLVSNKTNLIRLCDILSDLFPVGEITREEIQEMTEKALRFRTYIFKVIDVDDEQS